MGQQQLLLLVLGIVIVGLAVVVGIQAFTENMKKSNSDALVNDAIRIASDAQAWKLKPEAFGGGAAGDWSTFSLQQVGYSTADGDNGACVGDGIYGNLNGCFTVAAVAGSVTITAKSLPDSGNNNKAVVVVDGTTPGDIETTVSTESDASA